MSKSYKVFGGKIHIYGDLHLSCVYEGQHKEYTYECYMNMDNILKKVKEEKPSTVIFLGDIIGVNERNIRDRQFFLRVFLFFKTLNELTNGNVYSVKGNHDKGDFSDFDFLIGAGVLKNPDYLDYYGCTEEEFDSEYSKPEIRFHFVNYGEENRELKIFKDEETSNVVLGHADYIVDGVTNWYQHKGGVNLSRLTNFIGVDMVVSGHIHNPSDEVITTVIRGEHTISLFYLGSPARTAERFDDCWYMIFEFDGSSTQYEAELFGLEPADKVFYPKDEIIDEETLSETEQKRQTEELNNIVKEIMEGRMMSGDLFRQIEVVPRFNEKEKAIAKSYLQKAIDMD